MGNVIDTSKPKQETRVMFGRRVIKTDVTKITHKNVIEVLQKAMEIHQLNSNECDYLYKYYCGDQPILQRTKKIRPEICNRIVENRANEIVAFKTGYIAGEPIQYVGRNADEKTTKDIVYLNEMMFSEGKASKDQSLFEWMFICGTSYRIVQPNMRPGEDEAPFHLYSTDPRNTFVVYSNEIGNRPVMGVKYYVDDYDVYHYSVCTENFIYIIDGDKINREKSGPHSMGMVNIIEYPANNARLGAFEIVLPLLDEINKIDSNRMDGIEQFVQAFMKFVNCDVEEKEIVALSELGAIKIKSNNTNPADVDIVTSELNQSQVQITKEDCYNAVLTICGMPNRNGGSSTSDTGAAVLLRDGWSLAEARAKDSENIFKNSEREMLKLVIRICKPVSDLTIFAKDVEAKFTRRNYDNIQSKAQVLDTMLKNEKIHPLLAFSHCGMFPDAESAYTMSVKYMEELAEKQEIPNEKVIDGGDNNPPMNKQGVREDT